MRSRSRSGEVVGVLAAVAVMALAISGCSLFRPAKRVDMTPFAENTIKLVSEVNYGLHGGMLVYLREYADAPELLEFRERWTDFRPILRGIAAYSIAIVTLSKSDISGEEQTAQLANFLDELLMPAARGRKGGFIYSEEELDAILADIRSRDKLLDGLKAAQPLIDEIARFSGEYLDETKEAENRAGEYLDRRIKEDHADVREYDTILKESRTKSLHGLVLLRDYRHGYDEEALEKLLENDRELKAIVPSAENATYTDLQAIEDRLVTRLAGIRALSEQLAPDIELYHNKIRELDEAIRATSANLTKARVTIIIWSRTHQRLAEGVTDPARVNVMGIARSALNAALPL